MEKLIKKIKDVKTCSEHDKAVDDWLSEEISTTHKEMDHDSEDCPCSGGADDDLVVDLVVLIDSSGSMYDHWINVSNAVDVALTKATEECKADVKANFLFLDTSDSGTDGSAPALAGTVFTQSHEAFLQSQGVSGPFAADGDGNLDHEQGAKAVIDISRHYPWREDACRAVLYISDDLLDSSGKDMSASRKATDDAIAVANAENVTVFTHFLRGGGIPPAAMALQLIDHYRDLAEKTGGMARIEAVGAVVTVDTYIDLLTNAICNGCGVCKNVDFKQPEPCFHIRWADSDCDCMEGDDHERLLITAENCYGNVTMADLSIRAIYVTDPDGNLPPNLPDGSDSSRIYPVGPICFGDLEPCGSERASVTREAVIINRGLPPGDWTIRISGVCYTVKFDFRSEESVHTFKVCKN